MSSEEPPQDDREFFSIAAKLNFISTEMAQDLTEEFAAGNSHPTQMILQKGLLDNVEIDIVQTLLHSTEIIPDYKILGVLGKGGMGVVYRAKQLSLDRIVALKTVLVSQMGNPNMASRFEREAVTVARLKHPNIIAAYDFGQHDNRLFLAMEFVDGKDVEKLIMQREYLDEATTLGIIRQVASGLSHAKQHGIVHRDIKPANLLLIEPPEWFPLPPGVPMIKIADFGLAFLTQDQNIQTRLTAANASVGSPHYMSPEQINGQEIDHRSDIYALGATMYHMLTGRPPFDGNTIPQIIAQKLNGEATLLSAGPHVISEQTTQLVKDMLALKPEARLDDYNCLIDRIDAALQERPTLQAGIGSSTDTVTTILERPHLQSQAMTTEVDQPVTSNRKRRYIMTATLSIVVLLLLVLLFFYPKQPKTPLRSMVPSGWSEPLFNGQTLGALPSSGSWTVDKDDEGAIVIAGTNGMIRRPLLRSNLPLENYKLLLFVRLNKASAVQLHFGIEQDQKGNGPYSVLRITPEQVILTEHRSPSSESSTPHSIQNTADQYHVIELEYQHGHWWVFFDDQLIGTVNTQQKPILPEVRLSVEGGPAWFSDLQIEELVPADREVISEN
ncbi:serine/threonine protein kinase [Gimesia aquarii]|uniref:Serine/threonine-protein kinase PrkC n=1 Tax=Gimesia aquarii TaxID=2527964 RepID=A0A517VV27_9PLAN|nr:serine/threonine-protein kinase [Gimesia aquarii]QDT96859.1 Serine/threonine-protein kinase PrkC [Gimesia aquarii]